MDWLSSEATLKGKSLAVALALLHLANLRNTSTVVLNRSVLSLFSISPDGGYDALTRLAEARLIRAWISLNRSKPLRLRWAVSQVQR